MSSRKLPLILIPLTFADNLQCVLKNTCLAMYADDVIICFRKLHRTEQDASYNDLVCHNLTIAQSFGFSTIGLRHVLNLASLGVCVDRAVAGLRVCDTSLGKEYLSEKRSLTR